MRNSADVVVVGGGLLGCAVAAEVAGQGATVVLVERDQIAAGASGRNHGLIFRPEDPVCEPLWRLSVDMYRELGARSPVNFALDERPIGLLVVVSDETQWETGEREADAAARGGIGIQRVDAAGLRELEPSLSEGHLGGFLIDDGIRVDPAVLTLALVESARQDSAEICTGTEVKQILVRNGAVRGVATDEGLIAAESVVVAAGPWAAKVTRSVLAPNQQLPIGGVRGWLLLTEAHPGLMRHLVVSAGWHLAAGAPGPARATVGDHGSGVPPPQDIGTLIQQNPGGDILLGGSRAGSFRDDPQGGRVTAEIARLAAAMVPALGDLRISAAWSGVRPTSPDGRPLIGGVGDAEGLFIAGGHGGQGVSLGAGSARLAAQLLLGEAPFTPAAPFDPARFWPA